MADKHAYSTRSYSTAKATRSAAGLSDFTYSDNDHATSVHSTLDPRGGITRECRFSAASPSASPIVVDEDVTGSMSGVPRKMFNKLPQLNGVLIRHRYVADPQLLFMATGDATCDNSPLQVGQFEIGNEMDDHLRNFHLEGGGGGTKHESYELAMYFGVHHIATDAWEKDKRKGYWFIIGDEMPYAQVKPSEVLAWTGDTIQAPIPTEEILAQLEQRWNVYYIMPSQAQWSGDTEILNRWKGLLGQRVIELDDLDAATETIALAIGLNEGTTDLDDGLRHLADAGSSDRDVAAAGKALALIGSGADVLIGSSTATEADLSAPSGTTRI